MNEEHIKILAQAGISEAAIQNSFSPATLERGIDYFNSDRVEIQDIKSSTGQDIKIYADVFGSQGFSYNTLVTLKITDKHTSIIGECDCPVGFRCKHASAALLKFAQENAQTISNNAQLGNHSQQNEQEVENWLHSFEPESVTYSPLSTSPNNLSSTHNNVLLYLLKPAEIESQVEVLSIVARRLKKGGFGKARAQSLEDLVDGYSSHLNFEHTDEDIEIAGLLFSMTGRGIFYRQNNYAIKGDIGELALKKLLQTQRFFWLTQELNQPLQWRGKRELQLSWEHSQDQYELNATISPEAQESFRLNHFYYIDSENNEIGRAEHNCLSTEQVHKLLVAPPIPENMAYKVSEQLIKTWPEIDVPMPVTLSTETIHINSTPTADVLLHSIVEESDNEPNGRRIHLLSLRFNYDGHLIQPEQNSPSYRCLVKGSQETQQIQINRNTEFEQQCLDLLAKHHFISVSKLDLKGFKKLDQTIKTDSSTLCVFNRHS